MLEKQKDIDNILTNLTKGDFGEKILKFFILIIKKGWQ
jgi:hypothetical protein